ncbi:Protein CL16A [Coemansia spiralis]|nr:Protein CL16A [Coemansia spiralis]
MLGQLLALLGVPQGDDSDDNDNSDLGGQTERRRGQIERLAGYLHSAKVRRGTANKIVESVRQVSEVVIWSDRHSSELLSLTVEVGLHRAMLGLLLAAAPAGSSSTGTAHRTGAEGAVTVQILQTFSIILDSVTDAKFIYALFSNNFVNELIAAPVDRDNEEVLSYYVAFLKALSLRLTSSTIHFFFNERMDDFPLYTTAIALFDHPDTMVRVAVRAITLNVFRINDPDALEFILHAPQCAHFWEQVVVALRGAHDDAFRILVDMLGSNGTSGSDSQKATAGADAQGWAALDQVLETHMGLLAYLNDMLNLGVDRINQRITDEFRDRILTRTYVHAIAVGWRSGASFEETLFMQVVTLFLAHFFAIVRYSPLLVDTVTALFCAPVRPSSDNNDDDASSAEAAGVRLEHPFVPSPFETSRTLGPWLCAVLEVLRNKAISPTTLVKSVLTPRRMLRTRALLESLTGATPTADDCCSIASNRTALSMPPFIATPQQPTADGTTDPIDHRPAALPPTTHSIATAMVHIIADTPPAHSWITVDLAALVLAQLTQTARGQTVLDSGLGAEVALAQRAHSAELRAMLLTTAGDGAPIRAGSWKVLVWCLVDLANRDQATLGIKLQFEARHLFGPALNPPPVYSPAQLPMPPMPGAGGRELRKSSTSSATVKSPATLPPAVQTSTRASSYTSLSLSPPASPFERSTPPDVALAATVHQALHLRRLSRASDARSPGSFVPALRQWLGEHLVSAPQSLGDTAFAATVIDNAAKHMLPRNIVRLGIPARITCYDGCLVVRATGAQAEHALAAGLVWPLADVTVREEAEHRSDGEATVLRLTDSPFPPLFFPARPVSAGGIVTAAPKRRPTGAARIPAPRLALAYLSPVRPLDISLRIAGGGHAELLALIAEHIDRSRKGLADIFLANELV